ncbi:hypothetical protein VP01_7219g2, partial [Puccinia sorghi]
MVEKPKFHMLVHFPHSIRIFGPESLFATEKFESFNSVLRKSSSLLPIMNKCDQFYLLPIIQNSMGYKKSTTMSYPLEIQIQRSKITVEKINLTQFKSAGLSSFYHMMQFISSNQIQLTHPRLIKTTLNFQHNCHSSHCQKNISSRAPDKNYEGPQVAYDHSIPLLNIASWQILLLILLPHQKVFAFINSTQRWQDETSRSENLNSLEESEKSSSTSPSSKTPSEFSWEYPTSLSQ